MTYGTITAMMTLGGLTNMGTYFWLQSEWRLEELQYCWIYHWTADLPSGYSFEYSITYNFEN